MYKEAQDIIQSKISNNCISNYIKIFDTAHVHFTLSKKSSIITFIYDGILSEIELYITGTDRLLKVLWFYFKQNDSGRFDTEQDLYNIVFLPNQRKELELIIQDDFSNFKEDILSHVRNKNIKFTTSSNTFLKAINNSLDQYC